MKKILISALLFLIHFYCFCQTIEENVVATQIVNDTLFKPNYPEGVYRSLEDFITKTPFQETAIVPKGLFGLKKPRMDDQIPHKCYFYYEVSDDQIEDKFAVSYKGYLYFQMGAIMKYANKEDRHDGNNIPNGFVRVIIGGENYFYTEADFANEYTQMFAYSGVIGAVIAHSSIHGKGVVWDFKNKEFNIFKNCKDYNKFITDKYPEGVQECKKKQPNYYQIRKDIEKIK